MTDAEIRGSAGAAPAASAADSIRETLRRRGVVICISGVDGSGKTTLARGLVQTLRKSGIPIRQAHVYSWYANLFGTPWLLLHNRYAKRMVLILDRSIYDNIAVMAVRRYCPHWLFRAVVCVISGCYPSYDYRFYLAATFEETLRRRPDTSRHRFVAFEQVYGEIMVRAGYVQLHSDPDLLSNTLRHIGGGRGGPADAVP